MNIFERKDSNSSDFDIEAVANSMQKSLPSQEVINEVISNLKSSVKLMSLHQRENLSKVLTPLLLAEIQSINQTNYVEIFKEIFSHPGFADLHPSADRAFSEIQKAIASNVSRSLSGLDGLHLDTHRVLNIEAISKQLKQIRPQIQEAMELLRNAPEQKFFESVYAEDSDGHSMSISFERLTNISESGWAIAPSTYDFYRAKNPITEGFLISNLDSPQSTIWEPESYPHLRKEQVQKIRELYEAEFYTDVYSRATGHLDFTFGSFATLGEFQVKLPNSLSTAIGPASRIAKKVIALEDNELIVSSVVKAWALVTEPLLSREYRGNEPYSDPKFGRNSVHHGYFPREATKEEALQAMVLLESSSFAKKMIDRYNNGLLEAKNLEEMISEAETTGNWEKVNKAIGYEDYLNG